MAYFDVFNGDADGICALLQLRKAEPRDSLDAFMKSFGETY